jgi:predicted nucleic acid-binding Zn ribbon protein
VSRPARALAALRRRHRKNCAVCGKGFTAIKTARYCSNACRQKAKYERAKNALICVRCVVQTPELRSHRLMPGATCQRDGYVDKRTK